MKILLIDDDEISNFISIKLLKKVFADCKVTCALNGKSGLSQAEEFKPDVIFVDNNMPIMNGFEFLDNFKPDYQCRVYLLMSSLFRHDINKAETYSNIEQIVSKPLSVEKIEDLLL